MRWALTLLGTLILALGLWMGAAGLAPVQAQQPQTSDGQNPTGTKPTADSVNEEWMFKNQGSTISGRVSIPDKKSANLIRQEGREYQSFHEGWLPWIGAIAILGMVAALALFFLVRGRVRTAAGPDTGRKILRFNAFERFAHWMTAFCFIVLTLSGLNYIFGKRLLMPLIGPDAFGMVSQWAKYSHVYLAWPFMLGVFIMLAVWIKDNIPNRIDWAWLKAGGGIIGYKHPHAGRFNAGQKGVFWMVVGFGFAMSVTGLMMLFPFAFVSVNGMPLMQVIHAVIGVLFIAGILAHIYIGTLGMEGAFDAMGSGEVDLGWARSHHDLWVEQEEGRAPSPRPTTVKAHAIPAE